MKIPPPIAAFLLGSVLLLSGLATPLQAGTANIERDALRNEMRAYLLENPEILSEMIALLEASQKSSTAVADQERIAANEAALFSDGFSFVGGNPEGSLTVVEFIDYQCGFCRRAHPDVMELLAADGDIRWIVKEMPILGPASELAARAAVATLMTAGPEAYAALNDGLMRLEGPVTDASLDRAMASSGADVAEVRAGMDDPEVTRRIDATLELARDLDIQGTPSFVFADRMLRGFVPLAGMRDIVDEIRAMN